MEEETEELVRNAVSEPELSDRENLESDRWRWMKHRQATIFAMVVLSVIVILLVSTIFMARVDDLQDQNNELEQGIDRLEYEHWQLSELAGLHYKELQDQLVLMERNLSGYENGEPKHFDNYEFPEDLIDFEWIEKNKSFILIYYDNVFLETTVSPIFNVTNWTDMIDWAIGEDYEVFTQYQKDHILVLGVAMAYYNETGVLLDG